MLLRLIFAPILILVFGIFAAIYIVGAGLGWIFTGQAQVNITWPEWR